MAITPTIAIFHRENDDNLMDFGWISVQARAATGCLDVSDMNMFGLRISATLCKNHETLAGPASILSKLNFAASCGCQVAKVILAHASYGLRMAVLKKWIQLWPSHAFHTFPLPASARPHRMSRPTSPICCRLSMAFHVATRPDFGSKMST